MTAGERRERIRIATRSRTQRDDGGFDLTSTTIDRWASVSPVSAREGEEAGRLRGTVTYMIECDARSVTVTTDSVLTWLTNSNLVLNVREVRTPPRRSLPLTIIAEAGAVNSG